MPGISDVSSAHGVGISSKPFAVKAFAFGLMADGAIGRAPPGWKEGWEMRPTCQSWATMRPLQAWTAPVTHFQPATCSALYRRADIALALGRDLSCFRDDESGAGPLSVIQRAQRGGHVAGARTASSQGRHDNTVRQRERAYPDGGEEIPRGLSEEVLHEAILLRRELCRPVMQCHWRHSSRCWRSRWNTSVPVRQSHLAPARIRHATRHPMCRIRSSCAATWLVESAQCRSTSRSRLHDIDDAWHRRREASLRARHSGPSACWKRSRLLQRQL